MPGGEEMSIVAQALIMLASVAVMYWASGVIVKGVQTDLNRLSRRLRSGAPVQPRRHAFLYANERVIPAPQVAAHSHWPRDEVQLNDGTTVAYICRRCDHSWANEDWVATGR
jgi:hypothetical protein